MAHLSCSTLQNILDLDEEELRIALRLSLKKCDELAYKVEELEGEKQVMAKVEYGYSPLMPSSLATLSSAYRTAEEQRQRAEHRARLEQARYLSEEQARIAREELRKKDIDWRW